MDTALLFRKRTPLADDRLPWLRGSEEHSWTARRNASGKGVVSAILVRALLSALDGGVLEANCSRPPNHTRTVVRLHLAPGTAAECWLDWPCGRCGIPHGEESKVTYHLGVLAIIQALADPALARDFWQAYAALLAAFRQYGRSPEIKKPLCRAADELYFFLRYGPADPEPPCSRLEALQIGPQRPAPGRPEMFAVSLAPLTDPDALRTPLGGKDVQEQAAPPAAAGPAASGGLLAGRWQPWPRPWMPGRMCCWPDRPARERHLLCTRWCSTARTPWW